MHPKSGVCPMKAASTDGAEGALSGWPGLAKVAAPRSLRSSSPSTQHQPLDSAFCPIRLQCAAELRASSILYRHLLASTHGRRSLRRSSIPTTRSQHCEPFCTPSGCLAAWLPGNGNYQTPGELPRDAVLSSILTFTNRVGVGG